MVVDAQGTLNIKALAEAFAEIIYMKQLNAETGIWYDLYIKGGSPTFPDGHGLCNIGSQCWINLRLQNTGTAAGNIYCKVTRSDTGEVIFNQSYSLGIGQYVDISNPAPNFTMPYGDVALTFEIGH